jgi:4a-hydroxytetrahydrobiopterin dehydratase
LDQWVFRRIGDPDDRPDQPDQEEGQESAPGKYRCGTPMHCSILRNNSVRHLSAGRRSRYVEEMAVLTDDQVDAALPDLPGWEHADGALRRSIKFPGFLDGIDAVRRVAEKAEEKDHHPDIDIRWRTVTFALVTHSAGGITENDLGMAREINGIVGNP